MSLRTEARGAAAALLLGNLDSGPHCSGDATADVAAKTTDGLGGWRSPPSAHEWLDTGTLCTVERLPLSVWVERYGSTGVEPSGPVVIVAPAGRQDRFRRVCEREELLRRSGQKDVVLASANSHSYDKKRVGFASYVDTMIEPVTLDAVAKDTFYLFGDNDWQDWHNFTEHYERPPWPYNNREPFYSFGIGGSGSGVPFHTHGAVFAEVLWGRKRWFFSSPKDRPVFSPHNTSLLWVTDVLPTLPASQRARIHDCTLGPGEILWLGSEAWHATLNIGDTVFLSTFL